LDRIETTFRGLTNGTNELDYLSFKSEVFANFLPEKLANVCILFDIIYVRFFFSNYLASFSNLC